LELDYSSDQNKAFKLSAELTNQKKALFQDFYKINALIKKANHLALLHLSLLRNKRLSSWHRDRGLDFSS
jgi:hypothetical protein